MHQHRVTRRMAERVVDLLEAVEVDMQDGDVLQPVPSGVGKRFQLLVEHAAIAKSRQRIVQGIVLDAVLGVGEFVVLGFCQGFCRAQLFGQNHVVGDIEGDADQSAAGARRLVDLADGAHMPDRTIRQHDARCLNIRNTICNRAADIKQRFFPVLRVDRADPGFVRRDAIDIGQPVELMHALVPIGDAGIKIRLPHAALVGIQRQIQPSGD